MSFNPLAILHERQCAGIYNSLDTGRPQNALKECDAVLSTQPDVHLASALKAIALCRLDRMNEANAVVDKLVRLRGDQLNSSLLVPLGIALNDLDREMDEVDVLDAACKAHPSSIELASKACIAMARTRQWQRMQQTALRIHKLVNSSNATPTKRRGGQTSSSNDLHFWWSMQAYCLAADDPSLPGYQLALPLAQRMIAKHVETQAFGLQSDEAMYLYARILQKQGNAGCKEALKLLSNDPMGTKLCERSMSLSALRYELQKELHEWDTILSETIAFMESGNRNWALVIAAVDAVFGQNDEDKMQKALKRLANVFIHLADANKKDRTARLAPIYLVRELTKRKCANVTGFDAVTLISTYFDDFNHKACAFEDLESVLSVLSGQEKETLLQKFQAAFAVPAASFDTVHSLYKVMNAGKLIRQLQPAKGVDASTELKLASLFGRLYALSLPLSKDLPKTEMQPADDLALLAVQTLLHASSLQRRSGQVDASDWRKTVGLACTILHISVTTSPKAYRLRILLIRLLLQFGAVNAARTHYEALGLKGIQYETLGWILANRFATSTLLLAPGSTEERDWLGAMRRMRNVWKEGKSQVPAMMCKALENGSFSRVEEMITFGDRLSHSIARYLHGLETERLFQLDINAGLDDGQIQIERMERNKALHSDSASTFSDQRDQRVLLNFLPPSLDVSISTLSSMNAEAGEPGKDYLAVMSASLGSDISLTDSTRKDETSLTHDERSFVEIATLLRSSNVHSAWQALALMIDRLKGMLTEEQGERTLPSEWLQSAAVIYETIRTMSKFGTRASEKNGVGLEKDKGAAAAAAADVPTDMRQKAKEYLQSVQSALREKLAAHKEERSPSLARAATSSTTQDEEEWNDVLTKLSSTQKPVDVLVREQSSPLKNGTSLALEALLSRIKATLHDLA